MEEDSDGGMCKNFDSNRTHFLHKEYPPSETEICVRVLSQLEHILPLGIVLTVNYIDLAVTY